MNFSTQKPAKQPACVPPPKSDRAVNWLLLGSVLAAFVLTLLVIGGFVSFKSRPVVPPRTTIVASSGAAPKSTQTPPSHSVDAIQPVVIDDGKSMWVSPTHGEPLDLAYLAPGAQVIVSIRPAELRRHTEGAKAFQALGPPGQQVSRLLDQAIPVEVSTVDQLLVGCQPTSDGRWLNTVVVRSSQPISRDQVLAKLPNAAEKNYKESKYYVADRTAYYFPITRSQSVLVAAPRESIGDIIELAGQPPALRRDIERLLSSTDSTRQFTIVLAPNALFSEGQNLFAGELAPLRNALFWFLGDELSGVALSLHWDADFFLEVIAVPTLETSAENTARILGERIEQMPPALEAHLARLNPQPYGRQVVEKLPRMVGTLAAFTRTGYENGYAVLRCYLPVTAGHNLLLASELMLAEAAGGTKQVAETTVATSATTSVSSPGVASAKSGLNKVTSLKFARDTLESALEQLSQDISVPIVFRGADLQADGITKNQSLGIDVSNKPAGEILVEILRLANPDKAATGPHDPRQKLVYVLGQTPEKTVQIVVTTRARAAERRDELPAVFQVEKP